MLGLFSKIVFGPPIGCKTVDGQIVAFVPYASKSRSPPIIYLSIAALPLEFGELLKQWLGLVGIHPRQWVGLTTSEWWNLLASGSSPQRKALASLVLLAVWELWNEQNARVFNNKSSPSFVIFYKIKSEARLWVFAGARKLGSIIPKSRLLWLLLLHSNKLSC
jgi:hypothetical protein